MHVPDGFVSEQINSVTAIVSFAAVVLSALRAKKEFKGKAFAVPLLASLTAFVFAAQMLNFPIGGGTSGHFLGAVLAAALLGPWSACLVLAVVLSVQGVFFGDGGMTALGTNILNMGIIGGVLSYPILRGLRTLLPAGRGGFFLSAAAASWVSIVLASSVCACELALSGTSPIGIALPAMAGTHAFIGLGEALITVAALAGIVLACPTLIPDWAMIEKTAQHNQAHKSDWSVARGALVIAVLLATLGSPFASSSPDGLEKVAADKGFMEAASEDKVVWTKALFPDYKVQSVESEKASTGLAGFIGTMAAFGLGLAALQFVARPPKSKAHS